MISRTQKILGFLGVDLAVEKFFLEVPNTFLARAAYRYLYTEERQFVFNKTQDIAFIEEFIPSKRK